MRVRNLTCGLRERTRLRAGPSPIEARRRSWNGVHPRLRDCPARRSSDCITSEDAPLLARGTTVMAIDNSVPWLRRVTLAVAVVMIGWGSSIVLGQPVTAWFATSAAIWMALLLISALWQLRGSFTAIAGLALATAVVARLFSILRLHPPADLAGLRPDDLDLLVATGPGVPGFELLGWILGALVSVQFILRSVFAVATAESRESSLNVSALTFIRVYVGLMFVPHFGSHILGGPFQFKIYTLYFASLGL